MLSSIYTYYSTIYANKNVFSIMRHSKLDFIQLGVVRSDDRRQGGSIVIRRVRAKNLLLKNQETGKKKVKELPGCFWWEEGKVLRMWVSQTALLAIKVQESA